MNVSKMSEAFRDTVMGAAKQRVDEKKQQKNNPWFDEECFKFDEERKQARQWWLRN